MARTSNESLELWRRVAAGQHDDATDAWLRETAQRIVDEVFLADFTEGANRRAEAAQKALGWLGRIESFPGLGELSDECAGMSNRQIGDVAGLILPIEDNPKKITKAVEYLRRKRKPPK